MKAVPRTRSVTAKVTEEDYQKCLTAAGRISVSEWNRALIIRELAQGDRVPVDSHRLTEEMAALRAMILKLFTAIDTARREVAR
jgi:hypothetical protein